MPGAGTESEILQRSLRLHQELLAKRVASARSRHDEAMVKLQRAIEDNHPNGQRHPDGWQRILEARVTESDALSEYIAALRAYAETPSVSLQVV